MARNLGVLSLAFALLPLAGCKWVAAPFLMWGPEPTKAVPAEYPYLDGKKVCILVWADSDTLFQFRNVQLEVSEFVAEALKTGVKKISIVPNRSVVDYQRSDPNWDRTPPGKIGARFSADRVLLIELTQY